MNFKLRFCLVIVLITALLVGCNNSKRITTLRIAEQYGLAYAPLILIKELGIDKKYSDEVNIEWQKLGNTATISEAMASDKLDIGFIGIPPLLIGYDSGVKWKMFTGLSQSPLGLVAKDDRKTSILDIDNNDRIALPQPGSIQHILLAMEAERLLGDAKRFDMQLVTMKHPDGMNALLADTDVTMHFTSPPYLFKEIEEGNKLLLSGNEAFGGSFTFLVGAATEQALINKSEEMGIFLEMLDEAIEYLEKNPEDAVRILADSFEIDDEILRDYIDHPDNRYSREIVGLEKFVDFMYKEEYLKSKTKFEDLFWSVN